MKAHSMNQTNRAFPVILLLLNTDTQLPSTAHETNTMSNCLYGYRIFASDLFFWVDSSLKTILVAATYVSGNDLNIPRR